MRSMKQSWQIPELQEVIERPKVLEDLLEMFARLPTLGRRSNAITSQTATLLLLSVEVVNALSLPQERHGAGRLAEGRAR